MTVGLSNSGQEPLTGQLVLPEVATEPRDVSLLPGAATEISVGLLVFRRIALAPTVYASSS